MWCKLGENNMSMKGYIASVQEGETQLYSVNCIYFL